MIPIVDSAFNMFWGLDVKTFDFTYFLLLVKTYVLRVLMVCGIV